MWKALRHAVPAQPDYSSVSVTEANTLGGLGAQRLGDIRGAAAPQEPRLLLRHQEARLDGRCVF